MATIGLDSLYYSIVTEAESTGYETYAAPVAIKKAISADISINIASGKLHGDDGVAEVVSEFVDGTISLNVCDLTVAQRAALLGETVDENGVLVSHDGDVAPYVALGMRSKRANGKYEYVWLYKVKFQQPAMSFQTKTDSVSFQTPTITGDIMRRNKPDAFEKNPWRSYVVDGVTGVDAAVISGWFSEVYEPEAETPTPGPDGNT